MGTKNKMIAVQFIDQEAAGKLYQKFRDDIKKVLTGVALKRSTEPIADYALTLVEAMDEAMMIGYKAGMEAQKEIVQAPVPVKNGGLVN